MIGWIRAGRYGSEPQPKTSLRGLTIYRSITPRDAAYVFDDYGLVERALKEWFPNELKTPREYRLLLDAVTHKADTVWLNANSDQWMQNSEKYWQGEMTQSPFPEVLIHGALYFPDWQTYPAI